MPTRPLSSNRDSDRRVRRNAAAMLRPLLWLACLLPVACGTPPYPVPPIGNDAEEYARVVVLDADLRGHLRAGSPVLERLESGQLQVLVPLRNITDRELQLLAETEFRDGEGHPYGDRTPRQVVLIPAGSTVNHRARSLHARAADFVMRLQWNR